MDGTLQIANHLPTDWLYIIPIKSIRISISIFKMRKLIKVTQVVIGSTRTGDKAYTCRKKV